MQMFLQNSLQADMFDETLAAFLDAPPEGGMSSLFLCTLEDRTDVTTIETAERVDFRGDDKAVQSHEKRFQEKIIMVATALGLE